MQGATLELVYVSHIDNDHISGVLQLLEDEAEWRVFDLHQADRQTRSGSRKSLGRR